LIKIGIIIDKYHLEKKVSEFLKYLEKKVEVRLYVEESYFLDFSKINFDENIFLVKAKGDLVLSLAKVIERETSIPIINSSNGIWLAFNRFLNSTLLRKAGIPVPDFSLNPVGIPPPFEEYIIKNIRDQKNYAFKPEVKRDNGNIKVSDERAIIEAKNSVENYNYLYYQKFIKSEWEYKVYKIGEELYFYRQIPILVNPDKMKSREKIEEINELKELALKAVKIIKLRIASMDFLQTEDGKFYLTDINSSPNFNYIKNGPKIVADYLISQAKK